jgi:hypothetical protein
MGAGAADKAAIQRVEVPPCQLPDFRHVAMPVLWAGNDPRFGLVYTARPPKTLWGLAVGATWGPSESRSLNMSE